MKECGIPSARYEIFGEYTSASKFIEKEGAEKMVIKASCLAGGKGVYLPNTVSEALEVLEKLLVKKIYGDTEVIIEERLEGEEVSVMCICDGYHSIQLPAAQDHKRLLDGDNGPNTGGMGAYAPVPFYTNKIKNDVEKTIINPTLRNMRRLKMPYVGVLFLGLMLTKNGPMVLEYNVRFGDPETQAILQLLSCDMGLFKILEAAYDGYLDTLNVSFTDFHAVTVVLASKGYPGEFKKNFPIKILPTFPNEPNIKILHSGTNIIDSKLCAVGGRVLSVVVSAESIKIALDKAYSAIQHIQMENSHYRKDIAKSCVAYYDHVNKSGTTYEEAGVSINKADILVSHISKIVEKTKRDGVINSIGLFGSLFDVKNTGFIDPILVSSADGVGTKIMIALECRMLENIGYDLVAMNVNDVLSMGAEPLFFLDYYACGHLDLDQSQTVLKSVASACVEANCALIGGETSEMPGLYRHSDIDLAGFCVGARERSLNFPNISAQRPGDVLIGIPSNGIHSNGYSLVRHILSIAKISYYDKVPYTDSLVCKELLRPTKIYVKPVLAAIKAYPDALTGIAHITGGGIPGNLSRILNPKVNARIDFSAIPIQKVFKWIKKIGNVSTKEMINTFNCGIGMILIVNPSSADKIMEILSNHNCPSVIVGHLSLAPISANNKELVDIVNQEVLF